jgi:hypothetical protein
MIEVQILVKRERENTNITYVFQKKSYLFVDAISVRFRRFLIVWCNQAQCSSQVFQKRQAKMYVAIISWFELMNKVFRVFESNN